MTGDIQNLAREFQRLEAENLRLKVGVAFLFCALFALFLSGVTRSTQEVVAERFVLVDEEGTPQATLSCGPKGPVLAFLGSNGKMRIAMVSTEAMAGIALCDVQGIPRMGIALVENIAGIAFGDPRGTLRMGMALTEKDPIIGFYDSQGNLIRQLP